MAVESPAERAARLLAEGLEHFGEDRVDQAVACWRVVLELDPAHQEARDYLESAGVGLDAGDDVRARLAAAWAALDAGDAAAAFDELAAATAAAPGDLEAQAAFDLVRAQLYPHYLERSGDGSACPRLRVAPEELMRLDLAPEAGFLLSLVDGRTPVSDLVTVSGLDPFVALHLLGRFERDGIVDLAA